MSILSSGMWCDLCQKPILFGYWWHAKIQGKEAHCHEECKQGYEKAQAKFLDGANLKHDEPSPQDSGDAGLTNNKGEMK